MTWLNERGLSGEVICGFSFVLLGTFLFFLIRSFAVKQTGKVVPQIIAVAVIVSILLTVQWKGPAFCGWRLINKLFPGARSIRAVARFIIFLNLPMSIATACLWDLPKGKKDGHSVKNRCDIIISCCLLLMLLLSDVNTRGAPSSWDAATSEKRMAMISAPPESCESFYINPTKSEDDPSQVFSPTIKQLDAYEIAERFGVPTLNGYSGLVPSGWNMRSFDEGTYLSAVEDWVQKHSLQNVYAYSQEENQWIKHG